MASAIRPDYSLGSHAAALGVSFSTPAMGAKFADGVFVGEHGSWNRSPPVGYKVVFVPFHNRRPARNSSRTAIGSSPGAIRLAVPSRG